MALGTAAAAAAVVLVVSGGSSEPPATRDAAVASDRTTRASSRSRFRSASAGCSTRSEADFPGAFADPRNLVVGPLVLVGGAFTPASTVREVGGNKFPLLVAAGHTVTVRLAERAPTFAGLAYGPLPQGEIRLRDTYRSVTFAACRPGRPTRQYSPDGPSGSTAGGVAVTFWSGFVLTRVPACIPLDVYVDDAPSPRRVGLSLGRRCRGGAVPAAGASSFAAAQSSQP
jgi:hypothetical protein